MEEIISDFLDTMFGYGVYVLAIALLLMQIKSIERHQVLVSSRVDESVVLTQSNHWESAEETLSYKDLCTRMMHGIPCDVKIDGQLVEKQWFNSNTFDYSIIHPGHSYRVEYAYDSDGNIMQIAYISI